jgi:hypothetical protein
MMLSVQRENRMDGSSHKLSYECHSVRDGIVDAKDRTRSEIGRVR